MKKTTTLTLLGVMLLSLFAVSPAVSADTEVEFKYGVGSLPHDLDPHQAWDSASNDVIDQVCEGLFSYNLSDPNLAIVPQLATALGTWNAEATELTVTLRQDVTFHDGSVFDADDVVWNFDRLNNLCDIGESQLSALYAPIDEELVINNTEKIDQFTVKFHLNYAYVAFVPLLCYTGSRIMSATSGYPTDALLTVADDILVGTGPFKYIETTAEMTKLEGYDDYYLGAPAIDKLYFILFDDGVTENNAFLSGDIDWLDGALPEFLEQYEADPNFYVGEQRMGTTTGYMGFNNAVIEKVLRNAMSYAIDYDYIIDEIYQGNAMRLTSPVPNGIMFHHDCDVATLDVETARGYMLDYMTPTQEAAYNLGTANVTDNDDNSEAWSSIAINNPIYRVNFTWNSGNAVRGDIGMLVRNNLMEIGINVELCPLTWSEYLNRLYGSENNKLMLYLIGWAPDFNDPSNYIDPLMGNASSSNSAQVNDPQLQEWIKEGLEEPDATAREAIYVEMQEYIVEDLMPWAFFTQGLGVGVRSMKVEGIIRNAMGALYFYPIHFVEFTPEDGEQTGIPGYSLVALIGVAAISISALIYKKRS